MGERERRKGRALTVLKVLAFVSAVFLVFGCEGPRGPQGPEGPQGPQGPAGQAIDKGAISGTVTDAGGTPIEGASIALTPDLGSATTDSNGHYTISDLPVGVYRVVASASGYNSAENLVGVVAGQTTEVNFSLSPVEVPNNAPTVSLTGALQVGYNSLVTLSAVASDPDGDTLTYEWSINDPQITLSPNNETVTFYTKPLTSYIDISQLPKGVIPISPDTQGKYTVTVKVSDGKGGVASVSATVTSASTSSGLRNVPKGVRIYIISGDGSNNWSCTDPSSNSCSSSVFGGAGDEVTWLMPDRDGKYTLTTSSVTIEITAGSWQGVIEQNDQWGTVAQSNACSQCHNGTIASDKFTPWSGTGHAVIFSLGIDGVISDHYAPYCLSCHTVGYDESANNGGFDDVAKTQGWTFPSVLQSGNWSNMKANYPQVAQLANIQCENCHGPQNSNAHQTSGTNASSALESERVSFNVGVCAQCHDAQTHHTYVDGWSKSGHANRQLAIDEVALRPSMQPHCGRCHAGQSFAVWVEQVKAGNPGNISPFNIANALTVDLVQPQTCQACHDPHDATNPHQLRAYGEDLPLPAGFNTLKELGSGVLCTLCHNTRNGLHDDNNIVPTGHTAPHVAAQADVFLGRNAYFVGNLQGNPYLSRHASIEDACVGCHMKLNPDGLHAFKIDPAKRGELCANCHGATTGEGLERQVEDLLEILAQKIGDNLKGQFNSWVTSATYYVVPWDPVKDCYGDTTPVNVSADSVGLTEIHGRMGVIVTYSAPVAIVDADSSCFANGSTATVIYSRLNDVTKTGSPSNPLILTTDDVVKAFWNYLLIEGDGSKGIHNPTFVIKVLTESIGKL